MSREVPPSSPRFAVPARGGRGLDAFAVAILAATAAGWCGRWYWLLDLASHFRWYWLMLAAAGLVACLRWRRPIAAACLALAAVGNAGELLPCWLPPPTAARATRAAGDRSLVVVAMNVRRVNDDTTAAVAYLRDRRPDIVAVLEVDDEWAGALDGLADLFPHRVIHPRPDNFGIAVLSRWPLVDPWVTEFGGTGFPSVVADVRRGDGAFRFIATHPMPPWSARYFAAIKAQFTAIADLVVSSPLPCIVAGDLNATPWSYPFRTLTARSGLRDTAVGRGMQATWNARYPAPRIPIDHILAPPDAVVLRRDVGPDIGSDHFPVEAELILPARE